MLTLHTNFQFGSYVGDRNDLIKHRENDVLADPNSKPTNIQRQLQPHFDEKRSIAIGYGLDLLTNSIATINDFLNRTGVPLLSQHDLGLIITARAIVAQTPSNQPLSSQSIAALRNLAQQFNLVLPNEVTAGNILSLDLEQRELRLDAFLLRNGITVGPSQERVALMSLYFNSRPTFVNNLEVGNNLIGSKLLAALQSGNRANAWFEIRYNTNSERFSSALVNNGIAKGIANRRYIESNTFGLYDGNNQPLTESEARNAVAVLNSHQRAIASYEGQFSPQGGPIKQQILPAVQLLIASLGDPSNQDVLVASGPLGNGDAIQGTDVSELLLGDIGHDILIGGGGDDVLRGEQGKDVYVYNSGDGNDKIFDTDGQGLVVFDHQLLAGGIKKQSEGVYKSFDGQITYQRSGNDLVVNGTLTLKDWQEGQFGIRLKDLPDVPEQPGEGGGGRDYKRIDHYEQIGVDANGQPIFVPVLVDFFDEGNNISSDSALIPPIGDENNSINALGGNDSVSTGAGNDSINGGEGNDNLNSGGGADTLFGGNGNDSLAAGDGDDWLWGGMGNDGLGGGDDKDQLFGEEGDDGLNGGKGDDRLFGGAGKDTLDGGAGNDYVTVDGPNVASETSEQVASGGTGSDVVIGGAGRDWLFGDTQNHTEIDQHGDDWIDGGAGDDGGDLEHGLQGGGGSDTLYGGEGNDWLFGDGPNNPSIAWDATYDGNDYLDGGTGDDELGGGGGDDILVGGLGNDRLFGDSTYPTGVTGNDVLYGDDGDDELQGMDGNDVLFGGTGDDSLWGDDPNEPSATGDDFLDGGEGIDFLVGGTGTDIVLGGDGDDTLYAGKYDDPHADEADTLRGEGGNDVLYGEGGADTMLEGEGDDVLIGDDVFFLNLFGAVQFVASSASGNDVLDGGAGNDRVYGSGGSDTISGGDGDDLLMGDDYVVAVRVPANNPYALPSNAGQTALQQSSDSGNDMLDGGDGNDVLIGAGGDDTLFGGTGDDYLTGDYSGTVLAAGVLGNDVLDGGDGNDVLLGGGGTDDLSGGAGDDQLFGEDGNDLLAGGDGNDVLDGGIGDDVLVGGVGVDQLSGGDGNDVLDGGAGDELLRGGNGSDRYVFGLGYGQDRIEESFDGSTSVVQITGGVLAADVTVARHQDKSMGIDNLVLQIEGTGDSLTLVGAGVPGAYSYSVQFADGTVWNAAVLQDKARQVAATDSATTVTGFDDSDDVMTGSSGANVIYASLGNDSLSGGAGHDVLYGGSGNDTYQFGRGAEHDSVFDRSGTLNTVQVASGTAPNDLTVVTHGPHLDLVVNGTNDRMTLQYFLAGDSYQSYQVQFADGTVWTAATLLAQAGLGVVSGTDSDDVLASAPGATVLAGGAGNDLYLIDDAIDTVVEQAGDGVDTVHSTVSYRLGEAVENLVLTGTDAIDGTGNSLDNILTGNSSDNILDGAAGADVLVGGAGDDTYRIDQVGDVVTEGAGEGIDTVESRISYQLGDYVEHLTLTGTSAINGTGNELDNTVTGNDAANVLDGAGGADLLIGQGGDDTYLVGVGDTVVEEAAGGTDTVLSSQSYTLGAYVENLTLTGSAAIDGTGNALSNVLVGNAAANVLSGGAGDDTYVVGAGDTVVEEANDGLDTIVAAQSYVLGANVENLSFVGVDAIDGTGNELENILRGNAGDNVLSGGMGGDSYVFERGFGQDTVIEDDTTVGAIDTVQLSDGILSSDVGVSRTGDDLVLTVRGTSDQITIQSYFIGTAHQIEQVAFDDGTVWDTEALLDRLPSVVTGTSGADVLYGTSGANTLTGGAGNDRLYGYDGNDAYVFTSGFGQDVILDFDASSGNMDTIELSGGFAPANVTVTRHGEDLVLALNGTTDLLTVQSFFLDTAYAIERVQFSDGTLWDAETLRDQTRVLVQGTAGDDLLESFVAPGGNPDHLLQGGDGDDRLIGDHTDRYSDPLNQGNIILAGEDKLLGGDGNDQLYGGGRNDYLDGGSGDDRLVGDGILLLSPTEEVVSFIPGDDRLYGGSGSDVLEGQGGNDLLDGGTDNDFLDGGEGDDQVIGGSGNDILFGGTSIVADSTARGGADTLDGGVGNDTLTGGGGNDIYIFGRGYGQDTILDRDFSAVRTDLDTIRLADDVLPSDVTVSAVLDEGLAGRNDLVLTINGTTDRLTINSGVTDFVPLIQVLFSDGTVWDIDTLKSMAEALPLDGTNDGEWLLGSAYLDDTIQGFDGDDSLNGYAGEDRLIGGLGDDLYFVDTSFDRVVERVNEGIDTVQSTVSYTLAEQVENLTLIGGGQDPELGAIIGVGNDLNNVLIGNELDNVLDGGLGDDMLNGGDGGAGEGGAGATGDDLLMGGSGDDTYLFNLGGGMDIIEDVASVGEGNRLQFGDGIASSDLTLTEDLVARTLTIQVGESGEDRVVLRGFDASGVNGSLVVETVAFADGSTASLASLLGPSITIFGTENDDVLVGTVERDGIDAGAGNDTVYAGAGDDLIYAGDGDDVVAGEAGADTIYGGAGVDYLYGGDGADVINGDDGNDVLVGEADDDTLIGGLGNDVLNGGLGNDQLIGGDGDDTIYAGGGSDVIEAGDGNDAVVGEEGVDTIHGGNGNDYLYGGDGDDLVNGDEGSDVLVGEAGNDTLNGGLGDDVLNGGDGEDVLSGEAGNDAFYAGAGNDLISGGEGDDSVSGEDGADAISGGVGTDYLYGGTGDDQIQGDEGNDTLVGEDGLDVLAGGAGNDVLNGGAGADQLYGGDGDDSLYIDAADTVVNGGDGYDVVVVTGVDGVTFNVAGAGIELMAGSVGNDVLTAVGSANSITFYGGDGTDQLTGGNANDVLVGEAGDDLLSGGDGNDVLNGGVGDDTLTGGAGDDAFYAGTGNDLISGGDGTDSVSGDEGNDVIAGGADGDYLYGGTGDDVINGDAGNDVLVGEADNDTLAGGAGNDRLVGGVGNDVYRFGAGGGSDVIAENDSTSGNQDLLQFDSDMTPLDLVLSQQANDLRIAIHGTADQILLENWFLGEDYQVETIEAGTGVTLLNAQVDQLIQAMASFSQQSGLTWDQAIDQQPQDVQTVLAASWQ